MKYSLDIGGKRDSLTSCKIPKATGKVLMILLLQRDARNKRVQSTVYQKFRKKNQKKVSGMISVPVKMARVTSKQTRTRTDTAALFILQATDLCVGGGADGIGFNFQFKHFLL